MEGANELCEKIVKLMESYNMKVYDFEYVNELIEKTPETEGTTTEKLENK
jgi:hypothetical protein